MTKTKTYIVFYIRSVLLYIISVGEIHTKGNTLKSMEGNGIVFSGMCKKMLKFFFTPMYFNRS